MLTLWRGNANAWECDELGHLNVRFYLAKAWEAVEALAGELGMHASFQPGATATLIAREVIVRFLAEARPGAPLVIRGSVRDFDAAGMTADLIMDHAALARPAAAFTFRLEHVDPVSAKPFAWSWRARSRLEALASEAPVECAPRSLSTALPSAEVSLKRAEALGLEEIGRGRINPQDADRFGRMRAEFCMGKVSDSVIHLSSGFPEQWRAYQAGQAPDAASALLEARIVMRRWPQAGEGFVIRSGLAGVNANVRHLVHWVCDPVSGAPLWTMQGVGCLLDLQTRRLKPVESEALKTMQASVIEGLAL